jgi:peptidoglycan hydrolase-like protein with peptidoglycan-binding domain
MSMQDHRPRIYRAAMPEDVQSAQSASPPSGGGGGGAATPANAHRVRDNDHIAKIATQNGYLSWQTLWDKNPALAAKRHNPHVLWHGSKPGAYNNGDLVQLPPAATDKSETAPTEQESVFQVPDSRIFLRLQVLDEDLKPIKQADYSLLVDGAEINKEHLKTDDLGRIQHEIPRSANTGWLRLMLEAAPAEGTGTGGGTGAAAAAAPGSVTQASANPAASAANLQSGAGGAVTQASANPAAAATAATAPANTITSVFPLHIGALDPIQELAPDTWCICGVQARLNNLGFESGPVDGIRGPITTGAVKRFQKRVGIQVDGLPGPITQGKLQELHDTDSVNWPPLVEPGVGQVGTEGPSPGGGTVGPPTVVGGVTPVAPAAPPDYSGLHWVSRYPTSTAVADLALPFRTNVENFVSALTAAGATVSIGATLRPPERAHLMHYSWKIAREGLDAATAPKTVALNGASIAIEWVHVDAAGSPDPAKSKQGAEAMVSGVPDYNMAQIAVLNSNHIAGKAIDMTISWTGTLTIKDAAGADVAIASAPTTGGNTDLHKVGKSYGVIKLVSDPPHWSHDGH